MAFKLKLSDLNLITLATRLARKGLSLLTPKAPKLLTLGDTEQVNNLSVQNNQARIGEPQTILYGRNEAYYPALKSQPWAEYVSNEQVLHLLMRVTVGMASMSALRVGKTPITAFPGTTFELLPPGAPMTLFHPNVYTAEQLNGVELVAGIFQTVIYTDTMTFAGDQVSVPSDAASIAARAAAGIDPFGVMSTGLNVIISGSPSNDGTYRVATVDGTAPRDFFTVVTTGGAPVTFTPETGLATVSYGNFEQNGVQTPAIGGVTTTFDATNSEIRADALPGNPRPLDIFFPNDIIVATTSGAGANRYVPFTVLALTAAGGFIVTPAPVDVTGVTDIWLLRRTYGPYPVCPPGDTVDRVAFDLLWPQGIGGKGGEDEITMRFDAQYQSIDDAGTPTSGWLSFPTIVVTAASRRPYRRSYEFEVDPPARLQVRLAQSGVDRSDGSIIDTVQWVAARGFVVPHNGETPAIDVDSTTLAVTLRASNAVASGDDQKINGAFQRWLETWDAGTGWGAEVPTNSVTWAALDKLRGRYTARGRVMPDAELDLDAFAALDATLTARGDEFNGQISVSGNLRDNVNDILQLGRAELIYRWQDGRLSMYRDEATAPVMLFTDMNSKLSGLSLRLRTENDATGVQVSYTEPAFADEGIVSVGDTDAKPIKLDLRNGCTSRQRAWEAANFAWNVERYRNRSFTLDCELEPLTLQPGQRILVQCTARGWGQCAEVVSVAGRDVEIWPPLRWTGSSAGPAANTVRLRGPEGQPGAVIGVTRLTTDSTFELASAPDVGITGDATNEQRSLLVFWTDADQAPVTAIVTDITWREGSGPGQRATLNCIIDDDRVHASPGTAPADPFAPVITPPNLSIIGFDAADDGSGLGDVVASWDAVAAAVLYELEWAYTGSMIWTLVRRGTGTAATFSVPAAGMIDVRVRAFGSGGTVGGYSTETVSVIITSGGGGGGGGPTALAVSRSPASVSGTTTGPVCTSGSCFGSATGGTPPYSYLWQAVSAPGSITILTPTSASTAFRATGMTAGESRGGTYRLQVTDSVGAIAYSGDVAVDLDRDAAS